MDALSADDVARATSLRERLAGLGRCLVAFSAGVDSTYLLAEAHAVLGANCTAVTADSPSLTRAGLAEARAFCADHGITHRVVQTDEFEQAAYLANQGDRCGHCKAALMRAMHALDQATSDRPAALLLGAITDDLADWRPGMRAASAAGAAFPLAEAGLNKAAVRRLSRHLGLATAERPAEPCLSSRMPYGEPVSIAGVRMVEAAEAALKGLGLGECRARHHRIGANPDGSPRGFLCRIEVPERDLPAVVAQRATVVARLTAIGYLNVALDLAGLHSGGFNRLLGAESNAHGKQP